MSTHRVATQCDFWSVGIMPAGPFAIIVLRVEHTSFYVQVQQPAC